MIMANPEFPRVRACLFDMDGLLLDTEDIYTKCNNFILQLYGRPNLPWTIKAQMQGRPAPEAAEIFHAWAQLPVARSTFTTKQAALQAQYFPTAQPLPGVPMLLKTLKRAHVDLALATSSHAKNFKLKTIHHRHLFSAFTDPRRIVGDDPRIPKGRGKPAPDIYLLALETINKDIRASGGIEILPEECLVFEDSVPGVEAGRRAGMRVVWCPHPELLKLYRGQEREVLAGLASGSTDQELDDALAEAEVGARNPKPKGLGRMDDGWAVLVESLEDFPYERYGIDV